MRFGHTENGTHLPVQLSLHRLSSACALKIVSISRSLRTREIRIRSAPFMEIRGFQRLYVSWFFAHQAENRAPLKEGTRIIGYMTMNL